MVTVKPAAMSRHKGGGWGGGTPREMIQNVLA